MIVHITQKRDWDSAVAAGDYRTDSLTSEGFIHCSTVPQIMGTANSLFRGQEDLVLLVIDPAHVDAPVIYEDCYESGLVFPHIYGPLNIGAVTAVIPFPPQADGSFALPSELASLLPHGNPRLPPITLRRRDFPILEYDGAIPAILEPSRVLAPIDVAEHCVFCFFQDVITAYRDAGQLRQIYRLGSEIGINPLYEMEFQGRRLAVIHAGVGAPLAAAFMDEVIALGSTKFIACGGCGVLGDGLALGHVVVPTAAIRDEGTSYHYLPAAREVMLSDAAITAITTTLERHHIPYVHGKTWTTDAPYRETKEKVALRRAEGCLTVEMETAALGAVAQFRRVIFGQILYGGDDLSGDKWNHRDWQKQTETREKLFILAAEACLAL